MKDITNTALRVVSIAVSFAAGFFILFDGFTVTSRQAIVYGIIAILAGVVYAGSSKPSWAGVSGLIVLGAYAMARGTGRIQIQILRYAIGFPLIAIGIWGVYQLTLDNRDQAADAANKHDQTPDADGK